MDITDSFLKLREAVAEMFGVSVDNITEDSNSDDIDGWDSLAHATLVFRLERIFAINLPHGKAAAAQSLRELAELIAQTQSTGAPQQKVDTVFVGTDGHTLFHRDHDAVEQVTGQLHFTSAELNHWVSCIETRHAWCAARGIPYVHMIVPEKHVVYNDRLPDDIQPSADRPVTRLFKAVSGPARASLLYPDGVLRAQRVVRETYFPNDTHWNMYGGFLAYQELMRVAQRHLPVEPVTERDIRFFTQQHMGDLGARMSPEQATEAPFLEHITPYPFRVVYENKIFDRGNMTVYEGPDGTAPRAVMFRDSFSNYIIPHMIPVFSRLTVVGSPHVLYDLLRAEKPDIVFFEMVERFLAFRLGPNGEKLLPGDLSGLDTAAFIGISPQELPTR